MATWYNKKVQGGTKVKGGNTLASIAKANGVTVEDLIKWNGIKDKNRIREGASLYVSDPTKQSEYSPTTRNTYTVNGETRTAGETPSWGPGTPYAGQPMNYEQYQMITLYGVPYNPSKKTALPEHKYWDEVGSTNSILEGFLNWRKDKNQSTLNGYDMSSIYNLMNGVNDSDSDADSRRIRMADTFIANTGGYSRSAMNSAANARRMMFGPTAQELLYDNLVKSINKNTSSEPVWGNNEYTEKINSIRGIAPQQSEELSPTWPTLDMDALHNSIPLEYLDQLRPSLTPKSLHRQSNGIDPTIMEEIKRNEQKYGTTGKISLFNTEPQELFDLDTEAGVLDAKRKLGL